ncbi:diacylglycerol kinase family lipid kinase [Belnapia sp. T6]|uniref:Diacylglycerol kinase family lipid kinase n=1 Tax=Belnapia mucosa TaxID=2804532 RepID=A0ABS1V7S4_9PROT|nr:diacylglycerol kinase family protein [Belnapia mucosa]MBL6457719.1 diacylglycerol kinase family lipid kinase [Belnapia mucosa]
MLIVFNPTAGRRRRQRLDRALAVLRRLGFGFDLAETARPGHAEHLARAAAQAGQGLVVAAGGDGTIAEVAAGLAGSTAALGVLPLGTANVFAWELGIPIRPEAAASLLAEGEARGLYPGLARFGDGSARLFVQMLGAGFDAAVVAHLDLGLKQRIGRGAYVWGAVRELARYRFPPLRLVFADGEMRASSVIVSKGRLYAGRHLLAPAAEAAAPGFQVAIFRGSGPVAAAAYGAALPLNLLPHMPGLVLRPATWLRIEGEGVAVQADGDPAGRLPVEVAVAPTPLRVLLPRRAGFARAA